MMNPFFHFDLWDLPIVEANVYIVYVMGLLNLLMIGTKKHTMCVFFNQNFVSVFTSAL
jgi:hypothetical protein